MPVVDHRSVEPPRPPDIAGLLPGSATEKAGMRVLVVDDERTLRESCASVLGAEGYNVTACGRGNEALETLKRRSFDIVFLDLFMSQVPGMELLKATLTAHPQV